MDRADTQNVSKPAPASSSDPEGAPAPTSSASAATSGPVQRLPSLPYFLFREGSVNSTLMGGMSLGGSQDLGFLDAAALQHMQTLPRLELDLLLNSPKWKALLSCDQEAGPIPPGPADGPAGAGSASPCQLGPSGSGSSSAAPSSTAVPHAEGAGSQEGQPASPGVDQQMSAAALAAAWAEVTAGAAGNGLSLPPVPPGASAQGQPDVEMAAEPQETAASGPRTRANGRKRNSEALGGMASAAAAAAAGGAAEAPPVKFMRRGEAGHGGKAFMGRRLLGGLPAAEAAAEEEADTEAEEMMLDADGSPAVGGAFGSPATAGSPSPAGRPPAGPAREDPAVAGLLTGLGRVRLGSHRPGSLDQRRLAAAAAAGAALAAAGSGGGVARKDSGVQMLLTSLAPGSPAGGLLLPAAAAGEGVPSEGVSFFPFWPAGMPAGPAGAVVHVEVKPEGGGPAKGMFGQLPAMPMAAFLAPPLPPMPEAAAVAEEEEAAAQPQPFKRQTLPTKSHKAVATGESGVFTSAYRGVTKHRLTGRYEAHFWDSSYIRPNNKKGKRAKGRQIYLGGYASELEAARAYDRAVIAFVGAGAPLNFPPEDYAEDAEWMQGRAPEEVVSILRRGSVGFARGQSQYRGVTRHHQQGRWEARIGKVEGTKALYLGTFDSAEDAARAYDRACVKYRGSKAILNFSLSDYQAILADPDSYDPLAAAGTAGSAGVPAGSGASLAAPAPAASAAAAATAAAAGFGGQLGGFGGGQPAAAGFFLPMVQGLLHPIPLAGQAGGFGLPPAGAAAAAAVAGPGGLALPSRPLSPIKTRAAKASAAVASAGAPAAAPIKQEVTEGGLAHTPGGSLAGLAEMMGFDGAIPMDLAGFLLSPLAASLLSPLGSGGTPNGWRDSPLGRLLASGGGIGPDGSLLSPLSSGMGGSGLARGASLLSPGSLRHRRADTGGTVSSDAGTEGMAGGSGGGAGGAGGVAGLEGLVRLFSTPTSEADLMSALQWLDSLDPAQILAALESPTVAGMAQAQAAGTGPGLSRFAPAGAPNGGMGQAESDGTAEGKDRGAGDANGKGKAAEGR